MADVAGGASSYNDEGVRFDQSKLESMTEKERKKWDKNLVQWRIFMDFIVRHIAITTFKYNTFENEELAQLFDALDCAHLVRSKTKLKKRENPNINTYKVMRDTTDQMVKEKYVRQANQIRRFLDIAGRIQGIYMIASGFYKSLKKGNVDDLDTIKNYLDYWKGFTLRNYDYSEMQFQGVDVSNFTEQEQKYLVWPTVVRTAILVAQKFLKKAADATGLDMISADPKEMQKHMQAVEFVIATKIEDMLFKRIVQETKTFSFLDELGPPGVSAQGNRASVSHPYNTAILDNVNPDWLKPIPEDGMLLALPPEPPKDRKGHKKRKSSAKGKGRTSSASSHKGKKKKK